LEAESRLIGPARAGLANSILVFAVGFALGFLRSLLLAPRVGVTLAVLMELPLILGASWWISRLCAARFQVSRALAARLTMGEVAFLVLMLCEVALSAVILARPVTEYAANLTTLAGAIGLAGQIAFAGFPLIQATLARPPAADR